MGGMEGGEESFVKGKVCFLSMFEGLHLIMTFGLDFDFDFYVCLCF